MIEFFFFKQKTAYEMRISDWSSDVCSSDLVTIVSSDKDLMQLIEPGVDMLDTMKNARCGPEIVMEKFGVTPGKLGDVLALMGDTVDNVPGVPGTGPKTAAKRPEESRVGKEWVRTVSISLVDE